MSTKPKTTLEELAELRAENRMLRLRGLGTNITKVVQSIVQWGGLLGIAYYTRDVFIAWTGKTTTATISIGAQADIQVAIRRGVEETCARIEELSGIALPLALFVVLTVIVYAKNQARLRRDAIAQLSPFKKMYEKLVDPKRTSSDLTPTGETRPEDE